jgi:hypothetical protein
LCAESLSATTTARDFPRANRGVGNAEDPRSTISLTRRLDMTVEIRKPAGWEGVPMDDLLQTDAGQAYIAEQLDGEVEPEFTFRSSRTNADACSYDLFEDGSLWFHSNAVDEVWPDAEDFIYEEMNFEGLYWEDCDQRDGFVVDKMDRELLIHVLGKEEAKEFFERRGGFVPEDSH